MTSYLHQIETDLWLYRSRQLAGHTTKATMVRLLLRPSLWVALLTVIAYWDWNSLHGKWVYDDAGSVAKNVVVIGQVPWTDAFTRDFWGTSMKEVTSHKSFRPITTLSFKLNFVLNEYLGKDPLDTFSYKIVNLLLHALVSGLVTEASAFVFSGGDDANMIAQIITGIIFGLHPVHTEAVSNVTSRGEMLMSLFFLIAFISYATHITKKYSTVRSIVGIYVVPFLAMSMSLFSKEQGVTTLISLVVYDFLFHHDSLLQFYQKLVIERQATAIAFVRRTLILALQTVAMAGFRYYLNGESSPDFVFDQNPAGFSEDRFTRVFSTNWIYCLYIRDMLFPAFLCPDWSGRSISLIEEPEDERIWGVLLLWVFTAGCLYSLIMGMAADTAPLIQNARRILLVSFLGFMVAPFILSSNLLVVTGLMKADRVIYLPLLGFCVMEALIFKLIFSSLLQQQQESSSSSSKSRWVMAYSTFLIHVLLLTSKLHERNVAWSHSLNLWLSAYEINPVSHHAMYNCGYELSLKQRYAEAEQVMRPIGHPRVDGPSNTFVYAMVLFNLKHCDIANALVDEAMVVLDEKRATGGPRNLPHMLDRSESMLLVARAHCVDDISLRGRILYQAVQKDQSNTYAVQLAQGHMEQTEQRQKMKRY